MQCPQKPEDGVRSPGARDIGNEERINCICVYIKRNVSCGHICMFVCIHVYMCLHMCKCTFVCVCTCGHVHICVEVRGQPRSSFFGTTAPSFRDRVSH